MGNGPLVGLGCIVAFGYVLAGIVIVPILLFFGWVLYGIFTM